jgi:hypothetical protein
MAWTPLTIIEMTKYKPVTVSLMTKIKDCLEYLYGKIGTIELNVPNNSFEIDSNDDDIPDQWTVYAYPGGIYGFETGSPAHGAQSYKFVHPGGSGNGGGYLFSDYLECTSVKAYALSFILWATAAAMKLIVEVHYYDKNKVQLSSPDDKDEIYNSTSNPTTATYFVYSVLPPAGARYMKIKLIGGYTDTDVAGTAYFDAVNMGIQIENADVKDASIKVTKLNTTTGVVSCTPGTTVTSYDASIAVAQTNTGYVTNIYLYPPASNITLPGGSCGFYPQTRMSGNWVYAAQTWITGSGTEHWVFLLIKNNKIVAAYEAPDHPCAHNGGDENLVPHPFPDMIDNITEGYEIVLLDMESINYLKSLPGELIVNIQNAGIDFMQELEFIPRDMDGHRLLTQKHPSYKIRSVKR